MPHFIAMQLVILSQILLGPKQVQRQWCHTVRGCLLQILNGMNQEVMSALHGMVLETTVQTPVQLMYIVSNIIHVP